MFSSKWRYKNRQGFKACLGPLYPLTALHYHSYAFIAQRNFVE